MKSSIKPDKVPVPYTTKISMAVLALIVWAFVIFVVFGIYQKVFALNQEYNFRYLDNSAGTYDAGTEGTPYYIRWGDDLCDSGNVNMKVRAGSIVGSGTTYYTSNDQGCTALNQPLVNHLTGQPQGIYRIELTASTTPGTTFYEVFEWTGEEVSAGDLESTRIILIDPGNDEIVATSSSTFLLSVEYFLSEDDFDNYGDDDFIRVRYKNDTQTIVFSGIHAISAVTDPWEQTYEDEIVGYSYQTFSTTTTPVEIGRYTVEAYIIRPTFTLLGFTIGETVLAQFIDSFIMGSTTQYDKIKDETGSELEALGVSGIESSCGEDLSILSPIKFAICLFAFDGTGITQVLINAKEGFMTRVPFGYINRMYDIFTDTATTSLPTISYTFNAGPLEDATIDFNPWQYMYVDGAPLKDDIVSNDGGENIWEIVEPFYEIIVYLTLALLVFKKLTGVHLRDSHSTS